MEGIVGLVCCILCAFPLFVVGYYNRNSREPITFWAGDKNLKVKVKDIQEYSFKTFITSNSQETATFRQQVFRQLSKIRCKSCGISL